VNYICEVCKAESNYFYGNEEFYLEMRIMFCNNCGRFTSHFSGDNTMSKNIPGIDFTDKNEFGPCQEIDSNKVIETRFFRIVQMLFQPTNCFGRYRIYDKTLPENLQPIEVEFYPDAVNISGKLNRDFYNHLEFSPNEFEALKLLPVEIKHTYQNVINNVLTAYFRWDDKMVSPWSFGALDYISNRTFKELQDNGIELSNDDFELLQEQIINCIEEENES
jgi:hypothetical protein